jgi:hypothetical protein
LNLTIYLRVYDYKQAFMLSSCLIAACESEHPCILVVRLSSRYVRMAVCRFPSLASSTKSKRGDQPTNDME